MNNLIQAIVLSLSLSASAPIMAAETPELSEGINAFTKKEFRRARELLDPLARSGQPEAQLVLAQMYHSGSGASLDMSKAFYWYGQAAKGGLSEAQFQLGVFYLDGEVATEDEYVAMEWFAKAAKQGHAQAEMVYETMLNEDLILGC